VTILSGSWARCTGTTPRRIGESAFRRANITWRQEVGGSAIEASKIAGHAGVEITGEYTFVAIERQDQLTRAIQERLCKTSNQADHATTAEREPPPPTSVAPNSNQHAPLDQLPPASRLIN